MESFLVAVDGTSSSIKIVNYIGKILKDVRYIKIYLFHVLPIVSPNFLTEEEVRRIEEIHEQEDNEHLSGFFWTRESEDKMKQTFDQATEILIKCGIAPDSIYTTFAVESDSIANLILHHANKLKCSTIVVGRRGLGRVKEILLGSTSSTVVRNAKGHTVWVVDTPIDENV